MRPWLARRGLLAGGAIAGLAVALRTGRARAADGEVLVVGDSMIAGAVGIALERRLEGEHGLAVARHGRTSSGLARPDFFDWVREGAALHDRLRPRVVVAMFGGNDGQGLYLGRGAPQKWIRYGEDAWEDEYRRRVNALADALAPAGEQLLWIGMPIVRPERLRERVRFMNRIYRAEMAVRPNAHFIDIWRTLADASGAYADKLEVEGVRLRMRAGDGVHITLAGANRIVDVVVPALVAALGRGGAPAGDAQPTVE